MRLGAIVVAGGRATRMGGVDKAAARIGGTRLIDVLLSELRAQHPAPATRDTVVVSARGLEVPGARVVAEQPPFGGPVAAIAEGVAALDCDAVAILAVDAPFAPRLLPVLSDALGRHDVAAIRAADGYLQPLCAVWNAASLRTALAAFDSPAGIPVKALFNGADLVEVPGTGAERDADTLAELAHLEPLLPGADTPERHC